MSLGNSCQSPPGAANAALEGTNDNAKVLAFRQRRVNAHYHVQMVGHEADLPDINHWIKTVNLGDLLVEDGLAECRRFEVWRHASSLCRALYHAKDGAPLCNHNGHLIRTWHCVIVPIHATCLIIHCIPLLYHLQELVLADDGDAELLGLLQLGGAHVVAGKDEAGFGGDAAGVLAAVLLDEGFVLIA